MMIRITDLINRNFYPVWLTDKPHVVLSGGRSSMKSSVISLKLVIDFLNDPEGNVICLREGGKDWSAALQGQIRWAVYKLGARGVCHFGKSPWKINRKATGSAFYFVGVDDAQKLKCANIAVGYVMALWFEELAEFSGVED